MIVYKWTTPERTTRDGYQYQVGVPATAPGTGELCSSGWLHAYPTPLMAVMMRSAHITDEYSVLWECEAGGLALPAPDKLGCERLTLIRQIDPPRVTTEQHVRFAILAALETDPPPDWRTWAEKKWLSGEDRTEAAAWAAAAAAWAAAGAAAWAAAWAAAREGTTVDLAALAEQAIREEGAPPRAAEGVGR